MTNSPLSKPRLRGYLHQEAFFIAIGSCILLLARCDSNIEWITCAIYSLSLLTLFGISAVYHRPHWQPKQRKFLKRLDHSAIFIVIAGTFTPVSLLSLPYNMGLTLVTIAWCFALLGIIQSIIWTTAPKWLTAIFYIGMGWLASPFLSELHEGLGTSNLFFVILGGAVYTIGAIFYALKKPRLNPKVFGYHELFHLFTIIGAALHFVVIYRLIIR